MVKLSVVTINYNDLEGLRKTLSSVFSQTCFSSIELIVVDGGSSDGGKEYLMENDFRISKWVSEKDGGIYNAQNKGWKMANGEYVLFLNSGDYFVSETVVSDFLKADKNADILFGDMLIDENGILRPGRMPDKIGYVQLYRDTLWHPVSFIKRDLLTKVNGFDEHFKIVADYDFFCKVILKHNVKACHLKTVISVFDTNGLSSSPDKVGAIALERELVQNKYFPKLMLWVFRLYSKLRK